MLLRVELISSRKVLLFDKSRTFSLSSTLCFNRLFNHVWDKPLWVSIHEIQTSLSYAICQAVPKKYENIQNFWRRLKARQYCVYESHISGMEIIMSREMGKSWVNPLGNITHYFLISYTKLFSLSVHALRNFFCNFSTVHIGSTDFKIQEEINLMKNSLQKNF